MLSKQTKAKILRNTPDRVHPLLRGIYNTIFYEDSNKSPYQDVSRILEIDSPVIVDGGAYKGEMVEKFLELFRSPEIHAFEPLPEHCNVLREKYSKKTNVWIHSYALGDENCEIEIKKNPDSGTSSVFETTETLRKKRAIPSELVPVETVTVQQIRLSDEVTNCDIMKLDLQGYELAAIRGAEDLLQGCQAIITEVSFVPFYKDQPLFLELYQHLSDQGFKLYNLYFGGGDGSDGQISHGDAVFLKESVYANSSSLTDWFSHEN